MKIKLAAITFVIFFLQMNIVAGEQKRLTIVAGEKVSLTCRTTFPSPESSESETEVVLRPGNPEILPLLGDDLTPYFDLPEKHHIMYAGFTGNGDQLCFITKERETLYEDLDKGIDDLNMFQLNRITESSWNKTDVTNPDKKNKILKLCTRTIRRMEKIKAPKCAPEATIKAISPDKTISIFSYLQPAFPHDPYPDKNNTASRFTYIQHVGLYKNGKNIHTSRNDDLTSLNITFSEQYTKYPDGEVKTIPYISCSNSGKSLLFHDGEDRASIFSLNNVQFVVPESDE